MQIILSALDSLMVANVKNAVLQLLCKTDHYKTKKCDNNVFFPSELYWICNSILLPMAVNRRITPRGNFLRNEAQPSGACSRVM
jgi:hypothetical protein